MRRYFAEFNRVRGDNIRIAARSLRRRGLRVRVLQHRTALKISRPKAMLRPMFTRAIRAELQPRRGSVIISSESARSWLCMRPERPVPGGLYRSDL
jgi:hypothetical protein